MKRASKTSKSSKTTRLLKPKVGRKQVLTAIMLASLVFAGFKVFGPELGKVPVIGVLADRLSLAAEGGDGQRGLGTTTARASESELLRRTPLTNRTKYESRAREVNKGICKSNKSCTSKLERQQRQRGGNCNATNGNAKACDLLSDGRLIETEVGLGSAGEVGGKLSAKKVAKAGMLSSVVIASVLKAGSIQKRDPDYTAGDRTYVITVQAVDSNGKNPHPVKGVKVTLGLDIKNGEQTGCRGGQSDRTSKSSPGVWFSPLRATTNEYGTVGFSHCSHQQISIGLSGIPRGYTGVFQQSGGGYASIKAAQDQDPNTTIDNGKIEVFLIKAPSDTEQEQCEKREQKNNQQQVSGSHGDQGGTIRYDHYPGDSNYDIKLSNLVQGATYLRQKGKVGNKCDQLAHARNYHVRVVGGALTDNGTSPVPGVNVRLQFHGTGRCGSQPQPVRNTGSVGADKGIANFENCSRNQVDIVLTDLQGMYRVVPVNNGRLGARVQARSSATGQDITITIQLLKPYHDDWRAIFNTAATYYWSKRQNGGVGNYDKKLTNNRAIYIRTARCKPVDITLYTYIGSGNAIGHNGGIGGANASPRTPECSMGYNSNPTGLVRSILTDKTKACVIFAHEYGHSLGYPDLKGSKYKADVMFHSIDQRGFNDWQKVIQDTGCYNLAHGMNITGATRPTSDPYGSGSSNNLH
jgi:hypothetical protein